MPPYDKNRPTRKPQPQTDRTKAHAAALGKLAADSNQSKANTAARRAQNATEQDQMRADGPPAPTKESK